MNHRPDGSVERFGDLSPDGRPGNCLLYTREHFPELHDWRLIEENGAWRLMNLRRDGTTEEFHNLTFHDGPGLALEMRLFTRTGIEENLRAAGFQHIEFESEDCAEFGIIFGCPWSRPVVARKRTGSRGQRKAPKWRWPLRR